jgi:hypothetical protein
MTAMDKPESGPIRRAPDPPERTEGPTPNGGAYALAYTRDDGSMEIVECDAAGNDVGRTYCEPAADRRRRGD